VKSFLTTYKSLLKYYLQLKQNFLVLMNQKKTFAQKRPQRPENPFITLTLFLLGTKKCVWIKVGKV